MTTETGIVDEIARRDPDVVSSGGSRTWSLRARNVVVAITEIAADDRITEHDVPDEHVLLVPGGAALVVVPAGTSVVRATAAATVVRVFTTRCAEQVLRAVNHAAPVDRRAAPLPEPAEVGGDGVRVHRLRDIPDTPGRLGRIFRTASLMVNWFPVQVGPRDPEQLSPHAHEDAEQMSVTLAGRYVHHLRVPWTPRMSEWRDDRAVEVASPSMTVIPPTVVHTTRAVGAGPHVLVDVFAPPRADFLARGWVLNADEYRARPS
jgi:mannose-6-phosphate isomerase-like protein (cupin superfamily)